MGKNPTLTDIEYMKIKEYWGNIENLYDGTYSLAYRIKNDEELGLYRFKKDLNFIKMHMPSNTINFLDIGCGSGNFIAHLRDDFNVLEGIDISEDMINIARKRFKKFPNIKIYQADINKCNFKKHMKYDMIHIGEVLMYLKEEDSIKLLKKLKECIYDNSIIIVRETVANRETFLQEKDGHIAIRRTTEDIKNIFECAGLKVEKVKQNYYYNYAGLIGYYRTHISILKKLRIESFDNKIIKFFLLYIPLKLLSKIKRNIIINYFIILKR